MSVLFNNTLKIRGEYTYDYNILKTYKKICDFLEKDNSLLVWDNERINIGNNITKENNILKKNILINKYKSHLKKKPENSNILTEYKKKIENTIDEYKNLKPMKKINFFDISSTIEPERLNIIQNFIFISKKYVDIDLIYKKFSCDEKICPNCENIILENECKNCNYSKIVIPEIIVDKCDGIKNYEKNIYCFQGKQKNNISDSVLETIDNYLIKTDGPTKEKALDYKFDSKGRKIGTSLVLMEFILKKNNLSAFFIDIYLICKLYWDWKLFDISKHHQHLLDNFKKIRVKLPIQYRLFKELQMLNFECDMLDFVRITKSTTNLIKYDNIWYKALTEYQNSNDSDENIKFIKTI